MEESESEHPDLDNEDNKDASIGKLLMLGLLEHGSAMLLVEAAVLGQWKTEDAKFTDKNPEEL